MNILRFYSVFLLLFYCGAQICIVGCNREDTPEASVAVFLEADPPSGSTIQTDTQILVSFERPPVGLSHESPDGVNISQDGDILTITGPF